MRWSTVVHGRLRSSTVYDGQSMAISYSLLAFIRDSSHHIIVFPYYTVNHYLSQIFKIYKNCSTWICGRCRTSKMRTIKGREITSAVRSRTMVSVPSVIMNIRQPFHNRSFVSLQITVVLMSTILENWHRRINP